MVEVAIVLPPPPKILGGCGLELLRKPPYRPFQVQQSNIEVNPFETVWMPHPQSFRACPPGLEWLDNLDQVRIHERLNTLALGREYFEL